jgi:hypothetical protein
LRQRILLQQAIATVVVNFPVSESVLQMRTAVRTHRPKPRASANKANAFRVDREEVFPAIKDGGDFIERRFLSLFLAKRVICSGRTKHVSQKSADVDGT